MRFLTITSLLLAGIAQAAWSDYSENRELELDAAGLGRFDIDVGAGTLVISGTPGLDRIQVTATINVPDKDEDDALEMIAEKLVLSLERDGDEARLRAHFDNSGWSWGDSPSVDIDIRVPQGLALKIDDSSGSLEVNDVQSDVVIDDGSGSMRVSGATSVKIDDGSGSVTVRNVTGDVEIEDGSGSITVEHVGGSVRIDDGSGGIDVDDVEHDLVIVDDGSGGLDASNVRGDIINNS